MLAKTIELFNGKLKNSGDNKEHDLPTGLEKMKHSG